MLPTDTPGQPMLLRAEPIHDQLAASVALLGPCTPLPALYEEVLRSWRGLTVGSARLRQADALWQHLDTSSLRDILSDAQVAWGVRLLAATLWARHGAESPPAPNTDEEEILYALASFTRSDTLPWYLEALERWRSRLASDTCLPHPVPLLAFLKALHEDRLDDHLFTACVLDAQVLHPGVASHRPYRRLHRLLDYLGLSETPQVQRAYRRLVALIWPNATVANWSRWQWVTVPGGPEIFPQAIEALRAGTVTLPRLYELKYAVPPPMQDFSMLLDALDPAGRMLLAWLRPGLAAVRAHFPGGGEAWNWLIASNQQAAAMTYGKPAWWEEWLSNGLPAAIQALHGLQEIVLPSGTAQDRHAWMEAHLIPDYRRICANLMLAQAATGERMEEILALAADNDLPAIRALALAQIPDERMLSLLKRQMQHGGRPVQDAARFALDHLAHRQGLSGEEELSRQRILATAWEPGPFAGKRVRVDWVEGGYRLRLSLHAGKVCLETLSPRGNVIRIPEAIRHSPVYREAHAAQKEAQQQYRLFRQHLEGLMLEGQPMGEGEFRYLLTNPIFAHLAERLVWRLADGTPFLWAGPNRWETLQGHPVELCDEAQLLTVTLAHPIHLAHRQELVAWQVLAADRRLSQPFRQLFREIYTEPDGRRETCSRFAGRRVDPQRAYALLRAAGYAPGAGIARRKWPTGITSHICWAHEAASHDLYGPQRKSEVVTGEIWFSQGETRLYFEKVDPVLYSETLRAADLLTTRAAIGDADLTSRETIALRASLLREIARSFNVTNLAVLEEGKYALVLGAHATYRVNLASGTILLEPEGRQVVLSASDARWQPDEGGDAMTDILATVLTLAHDDQIDDLAFLAQLTPDARN